MKLQENSKALRTIFLIILTDVLGITIIIPLLPFYSQKLGASPFQIGLLMTAYPVFQLLTAPLLGQLSDRFGRKPILILSQLGTFAGFIVLAFSKNLWMVFISRAIDGATAGNITIAQAFITDVSPKESRAKNFGRIGVAFGLGYLIGPALSGLLVRFDYSYPIYLASLLSFLSMLATFLFLPNLKPKTLIDESRKNSEPTPSSLFAIARLPLYLRQKRLRNKLVGQLIYSLAFSLYTAGFALFAQKQITVDAKPFGPEEVGYVFAYTGLLSIIFQGGLIGNLVKRFGETALVSIGFSFSVLGYALLGWVHSIGPLVALLTFSSLGNAILRPTVASLISGQARRGEQGVVLGVAQVMNSLAQIISAIVAGLLIEKSHLIAWALTAAGLSLMGLILSLNQDMDDPSELQRAVRTN